MVDRQGIGCRRSGVVACIPSVAGGGLCGVRGAQVIAYRFAEDFPGDCGGDTGSGITQGCREGVPRFGQCRVERAHTVGAVDLRYRYAELFGEPVPQRNRVVHSLLVGEQRALQDRRGSRGTDMLPECLRGRRRDAGGLQQLMDRVECTVAFECGDVVRDGRIRDSQQPGQAGASIRRSVRAGEVDVAGVLPGVGLG
ncbi:hypothetical protein [Nocardia cyriacigeorgica]|uniref:hypothetical protein n=1 Tax=Nocardia cyriacigeorgica TaxID=135487 RepID=UPI001E50900B|nr:hypothetical protein [Nocardia cyriacigeorgica]